MLRIRYRNARQTTYNRQGSAGRRARETVKALIVANHFLETDLEKLKAAVSMGYARGKLIEAAKDAAG
jgi:hypothetical protein